MESTKQVMTKIMAGQPTPLKRTPPQKYGLNKALFLAGVV